MKRTWYTFLAFLTRLHWWFSQFFTGFGGESLPPYRTPEEIAIDLADGRQYKKDRRVGGLVHPFKVRARMLAGKLLGDCEDYAGYWAMALLRNFLASEVYLGCAFYEEKDGTRGGHCVVVFRVKGVYYWADYHQPIRLTYRDAWCLGVLRRYDAEFKWAALYRVESSGVRDQLRIIDTTVYLP